MNQKINDAKPHIWGLSLTKLTKASKKDNSFRNTVSLKKPRSFYEPRFTQHCKKYATVTRPKSLLSLKFFQQTGFWLVSGKALALYYF